MKWVMFLGIAAGLVYVFYSASSGEADYRRQTEFWAAGNEGPV